MRDVEKLIDSLRTRGLLLRVAGSKLILEASDGGDPYALTSSEELQYIKTSKAEIIEFLSLMPPLANSNGADNSAYRLTSLQEGMLFHGLLDKHSGAYIEQLSAKISDFDRDAFVRSWNHVIKGHTALRTAFFHTDMKFPWQGVSEHLEIPLIEFDCFEVNEEHYKDLLDRHLSLDKAQPFDFEVAPLMRVTLLHLRNGQSFMIWTHHHIIMDGWSVAVLIAEFIETYEKIKVHAAAPITQEDKYAVYLRYLDHVDKQKEEKFWRNYLRGYSQPSLLPFIRPTKDLTRGLGRFGQQTITLDTDVSDSVRQFCKTTRLTANTLFQASYAIMLYGYTDLSSVTFGVTVSGRPDQLSNIETRVGLYINTLVFFENIEKDLPLLQWMQQVQKRQYECREYQHISLTDIKRITNSTTSLFDTLLVFDNYPSKSGTSMSSLQIEDVQIHTQTNYPLTISVALTDTFSMRFDYNEDLLASSHVARMISHFENVITQIVRKDGALVGDIDLLPMSERKSILNDFARGEIVRVASQEETIIGLFERRAWFDPGKIAIRDCGVSMTYGELNSRADRVLNFLRSNGILEDQIIPLCIERSSGMIVGLLAILKAGCAVVPIDAECPKERLKFIISDTGAKIVLTSSKLRAYFDETSAEAITIENALDLDHDESIQEKKNIENIDRLLYVIYTSGTTGTPKGVLMPEKSILNLLLWQDGKVGRLTGRTLQFTNIGFDVSFQEILSTVCFGGTLVLVNELIRRDMKAMLALIVEEKINYFFMPYSVLKNLCECACEDSTFPSHLELVVTAGEQLKLDISTKRFMQRTGARLLNNYGPSESHVVTSYEVTPSDYHQVMLPPIGKPVDNNSVYILKPDGELCCIGVGGELCIGGVQVAKGYLNRDELTRERFVFNPFDDIGRKTMYKTGDICKWTDDGNIEFIGRRDSQIKIRGHRVELGEIEYVLSQCDGIKSCVVLLMDNPNGESQLIGYIVSSDVSDENARNFLKERLPSYMIPVQIIRVLDFPLTENGKVDKYALPTPDFRRLGKTLKIASSDTELKIAAMWKEFLNVTEVGIDEDFFELGGHSLMVSRFLPMLKKSFDVDMSYADFFQSPTISSVIQHIEKCKNRLEDSGDYNVYNI